MIDPDFLFQYKDYADNELTFGSNAVLISQHFINSSQRQFRHPGEAVVFNVACQSLKGPNTNRTDTIDTGLADVFLKMGARAYVGYDETDWGGLVAGVEFWSRLAMGQSLNHTFNTLSSNLYHEFHKTILNKFWADLMMCRRIGDDLATCLVQPIITLEDRSGDNTISINLRASNLYTSFIRYTYWDSWEPVNDRASLAALPLKYGFELSENEQFNDAVCVDEKNSGDEGLGLTVLSYSCTLTNDPSQSGYRVKPGTTYWARAYVHDGNGYNYSEPVTFTTAQDDAPKTETFTVNGVSFSMVTVDGGTFTMGASNDDTQADNWEKPAHQVTLSSYAIGQTEVTQALWLAVMGSNPGYFTGDLNRPVERVNWDDCKTFIAKLNALTGKAFRLPTEAEWEFAARGGNKSHGYKYSGSDDVDEVAWHPGNSSNTTHAVASKKANELGLYDMSGNVWEYCQDWFGYYSSDPQSNPTGPASGTYKIIKGGSWYYPVAACRVSSRNIDNPSNTNKNFAQGLRLAMNLQAEPSPDDYVDLGLPSGTLWATRNVGADSPEDYGDYFAWGETEPKEVYNLTTYQWYQKGYTKYCASSKYGLDGFVDNKTELDLEDDAACAHYAGGRMPSLDQVKELCDKCSWLWTRQNGVYGQLVTGPNGNTMFLPAAGERRNGSLILTGSDGYFWSRSLYTSYSEHADCLNFYTGSKGYWNYYNRYYGLTVRAVRAQ